METSYADEEAASTRRFNGPFEIQLDSATSVGGGSGENLITLCRSFVSGVFAHGGDESHPLLHRFRSSVQNHVPKLREASTNSARDLHLWTRKGSPLRSLLVISVGTITLLALTGLLIFMFFLLIATLNAIIISLLMSLAAAGGFLAIFFACLTAIYIGALLVVVFVISITTISSVIAVMIATGWVGLIWVVWLAAKKGMDLTKQSVGMASSAISVYSSARQARQHAS